MGDALVMMVVSEENLDFRALLVEDQATKQPVLLKEHRQRPEFYISLAEREKLLRDHPDAYWILKVPYSAIWRPPDEPKIHNWHWQPILLQAHRKLARQSLETFLNRNLSQLDHMVRTGWFILGRARAAITEFLEVPHSPHERQP